MKCVCRVRNNRNSRFGICQICLGLEENRGSLMTCDCNLCKQIAGIRFECYIRMKEKEE